ncbi:MAG: hypothetical protein ABI766_12160 [Gemmatimonadales bacterium]
MTRFRTLLLVSAAVAVGACSDTQSPSAPADPGAGGALTLQLDESIGASDELATEQAGGASLSVAGKGKSQDVSAQTVSCVHNAWAQICADIRSGRLKAVRADGIVKTAKSTTFSKLLLDGVIITKSGKFGPNFRGDHLFANIHPLNVKVFRGDRLCHVFAGTVPQICAVIR